MRGTSSTIVFFFAALAALHVGCRQPDDAKAPAIAHDPTTEVDASLAASSTGAKSTTTATSDGGGSEGVTDAPDATDAAVVLPPLDDSCSVDADCTTSPWALSGPYVCCYWCGMTAGNVAWAKRVEGRCRAKSPSICPTLACPSGPMHARCDKGRCVGKF